MPTVEYWTWLPSNVFAGMRSGVAVVKQVLDHARTELWDRRDQVLADHAAEVGRHQHGFEAWSSPRAELLIDKAEEVHEIIHSEADVLGRQAKRDVARSIESGGGHWDRNPCQDFGGWVRHVGEHTPKRPGVLAG